MSVSPGGVKASLAVVDSIILRFTDASTRKRSNADLSQSDEDLYRLLYPCLVEHKTNVAAFVIGPRGSGKSRLVENCIARLDSTKFRTLRLNGLIMRGDDVGFAVAELVRQLSEIALKESSTHHSKILRLKKMSFTSNLALLDQVFQLAKVDGRPILIILDELHAFTGSSANLDVKMVERAQDRQLLLYHILDRVAKSGCSLSFIGLTSDLGALEQMEKRVKSRAEGTSKIIFIKPFDSYASLVEVLLRKFDCPEGKDLMLQLSSWLKDEQDDAEVVSASAQVRAIMERSYRSGKDLRWFIRVLTIAMTLYRSDLTLPSSDASVCFNPQYFLCAFKTMGAPSAGIGNDPQHNARVQILQDLSGPQVAILLSARRILARDAHKEAAGPLTLNRILSEYQTYQGNANRYSRRLLLRSFSQMLETNVFMPSSDHTGGGPLQYEYAAHLSEMDATSLSKLPLHVPYDLDEELTKALTDNLLDCSTALKDWGKKKN